MCGSYIPHVCVHRLIEFYHFKGHPNWLTDRNVSSSTVGGDTRLQWVNVAPFPVVPVTSQVAERQIENRQSYIFVALACNIIYADKMHTSPRGHNWLSFYSRVKCQSGVGACARALSIVTPVWVQVGI